MIDETNTDIEQSSKSTEDTKHNQDLCTKCGKSARIRRNGIVTGLCVQCSSDYFD